MYIRFMKWSTIALVFISVFIIFMESCAPVYIPNAAMVFENEEEGEGSVKYRQGLYSTNIQAGYAVNDNLNIGLVANALHTAEVTVWNTTEPGVTAIEANAVIGYYNKFTASNVFEFNVGGGPVFHSSPEGLSNYYKLFAQPSISIKNLNETFKLSVSTRATGVAFNYSDRGVDTSYYRGFAEPIVSLSFGKKVQFLIQTGISIPFQSQEIFVPSPFIFNLGIGYKFGNKRSEFIEP